MPKVTVYGADWCPLTKAALKHLEQLHIEYRYINIEKDPAAAKWVADHNDGKEKKPTIDVDGQVLSEPSNSELEDALRAKHVLD